MNERLKEAIRLRTEGDKETSREILLQLVSEDPSSPDFLYQCAWTHDAMGFEQAAASFYERAIQCGLKGDDLAGAYLGLGSTLRGLGRYEGAQNILEKAVAQFPSKNSLRVFLAMALYNNGHAKEAVGSLLTVLAETTSDIEISHFKRAILFYAKDLDRIWKS